MTTKRTISEKLIGNRMNLKNITTMTEKRVKNLKISELELMLKDIPENYKKVIVKAIRDKNYEDLGRFIEQIIYLNMQKTVKDCSYDCFNCSELPETFKR